MSLRMIDTATYKNLRKDDPLKQLTVEIHNKLRFHQETYTQVYLFCNKIIEALNTYLTKNFDDIKANRGAWLSNQRDNDIKVIAEYVYKFIGVDVADSLKNVFSDENFKGIEPKSILPSLDSSHPKAFTPEAFHTLVTSIEGYFARNQLTGLPLWRTGTSTLRKAVNFVLGSLGPELHASLKRVSEELTNPAEQPTSTLRQLLILDAVTREAEPIDLVKLKSVSTFFNNNISLQVTTKIKASYEPACLVFYNKGEFHQPIEIDEIIVRLTSYIKVCSSEAAKEVQRSKNTYAYQLVTRKLKDEMMETDLDADQLFRFAVVFDVSPAMIERLKTLNMHQEVFAYVKAIEVYHYEGSSLKEVKEIKLTYDHARQQFSKANESHEKLTLAFGK